MSASKFPPIKLSKAEVLANGIISYLKPYCEKIEIAGSVRRKTAMVNEIECNTNLFDKKMITNYDFAQTLTSRFAMVRGKIFGRECEFKMNTKRDPSDTDFIPLIVYMPEPYDYYRQLAIRTGNSEFSFRAIAAAWVKLGWVGTDDGLRLRKECTLIGDHKWKCMEKKPTMPPVWESEESFFDWLELDYVEPEHRNYVINKPIDLLYNPKNNRHAS
jgi:DNA polymerase/3'-5' exonuclease PolX